MHFLKIIIGVTYDENMLKNNPMMSSPLNALAAPSLGEEPDRRCADESYGGGHRLHATHLRAAHAAAAD